MASRAPTEKEARRLRVLKFALWTTSVYAAGWSIIQFLDPTPGVWKVATWNVVAVLVFTLLALLARAAPLSALVTSQVFAYAYAFVHICLIGTGSGIPLFLLVIAALSFPAFGTERIVFRHSLVFWRSR
jgi:hypothetical protein